MNVALEQMATVIIRTVKNLFQYRSARLETIQSEYRLLLDCADHLCCPCCQQPMSVIMTGAAFFADHCAPLNIEEHLFMAGRSGAAALTDRKVGTISQDIEEFDHKQRQGLLLISITVQRVQSPESELEELIVI